MVSYLPELNKYNGWTVIATCSEPAGQPGGLRAGHRHQMTIAPTDDCVIVPVIYSASEGNGCKVFTNNAVFTKTDKINRVTNKSKVFLIKKPLSIFPWNHRYNIRFGSKRRAFNVGIYLQDFQAAFFGIFLYCCSQEAIHEWSSCTCVNATCSNFSCFHIG